LPAVYLNYIIPPNAKAESLIVSQFQFVQIPGEYYIYPAQPPTVIGETVPWVPPDTLVYNSDNSFPGKFIKIVGEGIMDGARIVTVEVCPLQYRPKTKRLFLVKSIGFEFVFGSNNHPELRAKIRGRYEQAVYDAVLRSVVENDNEILAYYQKPTIVEENEIGASGAAPFPVGPSIIIAPQEFHSAFQPYADWLTDQGIKTYLITPQTIYWYFSGRDEPEKIRNYIKYCYERGGTWFILGGDDYAANNIYFIPVRYCIPLDSVIGNIPEYDSIPCDMYFSDLTGDWNLDGDDYWGEIKQDQADRFPEVFVGRITAYNAQEVSNWVTKALHYEKTPGIIFNHVLWIYNSMVGLGDAYTTFPSYFSHIYAYNWWADEVLYAIDTGYAFFNVHCHGDVGRFRVRHTPDADIENWWPDPPNHYKAGLNWLTNKNRYHIGYTISCYCGAFDRYARPGTYPYGSDTCIADAFVDAYLVNAYNQTGPFGTCAYLANTRDGWMGSSHDLEYEFYLRIFTLWMPSPMPSLTKIGVAEALSKCGDRINWDMNRYVCYSHNLFGSPSTEAWTKTPGTFAVSHPTRISVGQQIQFTVTVRDASTGGRLQYATVCINKPNDIYQVGSTNANGKVTFTIKPQTPGTMKVTVTRFHNADNNYTQYRPSQTTCQVGEPEGGGQALSSDDLIPTTLCIDEMATVLKNNTVLKFGLPKEDNISLVLYDATGSKVKSLLEGKYRAGYHKINLPTEQLPAGIYFVVLRQNNEQVSRKFLLIK